MSRTTLLLDEPSMGLAPLAIRAIFEALVRLNREDGLSVLLAEQNLAIARRYAHRALGLSGGRSTPAALGIGEELASLYFEAPAASHNGASPAEQVDIHLSAGLAFEPTAQYAITRTASITR